MLRILVALLILSFPVSAGEKVVAGLSQNRVSITADFSGTGILIFGAVKREAPPPDVGPLHVVIAVAGPSHRVTVRRKARWFGIWVNTDNLEVDSAPAFYAVTATAPLTDVVSETEDLQHKISIRNMIRAVGVAQIPEAESFTEAVMRIRANNDLYTETGGMVELTEETLFRTEIALPSNLVEGDYIARIFLTRDKKVIDVFETTIPVRKVGLERWIYNLAHQMPLVYGLLSLAIAIAAGWLASAAFRLLRIT